MRRPIRTTLVESLRIDPNPCASVALPPVIARPKTELTDAHATVHDWHFTCPAFAPAISWVANSVRKSFGEVAGWTVCYEMARAKVLSRLAVGNEPRLPEPAPRRLQT